MEIGVVNDRKKVVTIEASKKCVFMILCSGKLEYQYLLYCVQVNWSTSIYYSVFR